jgi:hypothetical protein
LTWTLALVAGLACGSLAVAGESEAAGVWEIEWTNSEGTQTGTMTFVIEEGKLTGEFESASTGMTGTMEGTAEGSTLKFTLDLDSAQGPMSVPCEAEVTGDTIEGSADDGYGGVPWAGKRKNP